MEEAHVQFSRDAIRFFHKLSYGEGFLMDTTTHFNQFADSLERYNIIVMLNTQPHGEKERQAFQRYMEQGGRMDGIPRCGIQRQTHQMALV